MPEWPASSNPTTYEIDERGRTIALTEVGEGHLEKLIGQPLRDPDLPEEVTPEQARLLGHIEQAMRAQFLFKRNKDYLVRPARSSSSTNSPAARCSAGAGPTGCTRQWRPRKACPSQEENVTYATITLQNYFRLY